MSAALRTLSEHVEEENQRLRDRIDELEAMLGQKETWLHLFGLTRIQARFVGLLLRRETVSYDAAFTVLYGDIPEDRQPNRTILSVHLCHCRAKLKRYGATINTIWGDGFYLTAENKKIIKDHLASAANREAA